MNQLQTTILLLTLLISITIIPAYGEVICHKGNTIDIDESAVQKHIDNHGDTLGTCDTDTDDDSNDGTDNDDNDNSNDNNTDDNNDTDHDNTDTSDDTDNDEDDNNNTDSNDNNDTGNDNDTDPSNKEIAKSKAGSRDDKPLFVSIKINNDMYGEPTYETPIESFPMTKIVSLKIVVYESRITHIDMIQVGTVPEVGDSINESKDLMSFKFGWDNTIDSIDISENIDTIYYTSKIVHCEYYHECLELSIWYTYKVIPTNYINYVSEQVPTNVILALNTFDVSRNTSNVYLILN